MRKYTSMPGPPRPPELPIQALSVPGVLVGCRLISDGDEYALLPEEINALKGSVVKRRRASGAARIVARKLLVELGCLSETALPKSPSGAPIWPEGIVGSWSHDSQVAIAAVGRRRDLVALGIDIEPAQNLPFELKLIATARERSRIGDDPFLGRLLFTAKEAVYKGVYPLDATFLEHHEVEVDFESRTALVRGDRLVNLRFCVCGSLVTMAFIKTSAY